MRFLRQTAIAAAALAAITAYADSNGNSELTPTTVPANPDNFNGTNYTALTKIYTESTVCSGLPQVAIEAVYSGNTCMTQTAGGLIVTCEYQGVPEFGWNVQFFSGDLTCTSEPYINVIGEGIGCYQATAADGRTVSLSVDCGGGTAAEIADPATFTVVQDTSLPTEMPGTATSTSTVSSEAIAVKLGNSPASTNTVSMVAAGIVALAAFL